MTPNPYLLTIGARRGLPAIADIGAIGDSITGGVTSIGETSTIQTLGSYLAPTLFGSGLDIVTSSAGTNFQTGGFTVQQIIDTWLPQAITAAPNACVVHAGTNSLNDALTANGSDTDAAAAWIFAQLATIMTGLRNAGIKCVICTITPDDHTTTTANMRTVRAKTNALIRSSAASYGAVVCDWAGEISTNPADDTAIANTLYLRDNVHPSATGAWRLGLKLLATLRANFALPEVELPLSGDASWMTSNPYMTGDVSGVATGFTVQGFANGGTAAPTIVSSKTGDGWQRLAITGDVPGTRPYAQIQVLSSQFTNTTLDGRRFRALFDIRPVASGWGVFGIRPSLLASTFDGGSTRAAYCVSAYASAQMAEEKIIWDHSDRLTFETPIVQHPGGTGVQRRQLIQRLAVWGSGTIDIRLMGVVEIG